MSCAAQIDYIVLIVTEKKKCNVCVCVLLITYTTGIHSLVAAIPSLRARDCSKNEKEALNYLFLVIPLINILIPFVWKSFAVVWSADTIVFFLMYTWKVFFIFYFFYIVIEYRHSFYRPLELFTELLSFDCRWNGFRGQSR